MKCLMWSGYFDLVKFLKARTENLSSYRRRYESIDDSQGVFINSVLLNGLQSHSLLSIVSSIQSPQSLILKQTDV